MSTRHEEDELAPGELSDEQLAVRAQREKPEGRTAAFEELVSRLEGTLFGFLLVRVGNAAEAEELCQDAFLRAWTKLHYYDDRWRFTTWLFTLARRLAVSRARVQRPGHLSEERQARLADDVDPATVGAEREEIANVWQLASRILTPEQRSALWMRYAEDLSNEEIARILKKRGVSVRVLLFRAREALARALDQPPAAERSRRGAAIASSLEPASAAAATHLAGGSR